MEALILKLTPSTWDKSETGPSKQFRLSNNSEEYKMIESEVRKAVPNNIFISSIDRNQNLYDYGQLLIREQLKVNLYCSTSFYRVCYLLYFIQFQGNVSINIKTKQY